MIQIDHRSVNLFWHHSEGVGVVPLRSISVRGIVGNNKRRLRWLETALRRH
jgi:hypothetical protein